VNYERSKFYLSQTTFVQNASQHIIAIASINSTSSDNSHHSLPVGAVACLAVACILASITLLVCAWILIKRRSSNKKIEANTLHDDTLSGKPELDAGTNTALCGFPQDRHISHEIAEGRMLTPPHSNPIFEAPGDHPETQELAAK
jgi:hypothetical protein